MGQTKSEKKNNQMLEPSILVIFGFSGDLSRRKLIPALFHLHSHGLLGSVVKIFGVASTRMTRKQLDKYIEKSVKSCCEATRPKELKLFVEKFDYVSGNFNSKDDMRKLAEAVETYEQGKGVCHKRLFYLAVPSSLHGSLAESLKQCGFLESCHDRERVLRVVVEKPFGRDYQSAKELNKKLLKYFEEEEIYRIDHYLGKETVQNLLITRFANSIFEPLWCRDHIERVEITVAEDLGVGTRGKFYEETGALRDIVQNHMLQLLALVTMEQPGDNTAKSIQDEKAKVLKSIRKMSAKQVKQNVIRAQYGAGEIDDKKVPGYKKENNVSAKSLTETYVAMKLEIANKRWAGVPFYLRTGKRMPRKVSEILIHFKKLPKELFASTSDNTLTLRLQPDESIYLKFTAKKPGLKSELQDVNMHMGYGDSFKGELPEAYERLLLDWIEGDKTLFVRSDSLYASWDFVSRILKVWEKEKTPISTYKAGTWGPVLK